MLTRHQVAEKIAAYLQHRLSLTELVSWAESEQLNGNYEPAYFDEINEVLSRIGVADVQNFDLGWEDYEHFLRILGYSVKLDIAPAA